MFSRCAMLFASLLIVLSASAQNTVYVVPVATAQVNTRIYTTTLALRNDARSDASCEAIYAVPNDPDGGTFRARYDIGAGDAPHVERDVLIEAGAVGTLRLVCSAPVVIAARIQASVDNGVNFDSGRTYAAVPEAPSFRRSRTVPATADLFVAEVAGKPVTFEAIVTNRAGVAIAHKTYAVPAFAQQIVNLSKVRAQHPASVQIRVASGDGALVIGRETSDASLLAMTAPRSASAATAVRPELAANSPAPPRSSQLLGTASFHAAPFQDSFTGLVYFRNRWYDPKTATFLTPDPRGYEDSPNPYAAFAGDPVNRRDPTGEAAAMGNSGWIIATDNRNGGARVRFSPEQIARDPAGVRRFLGENADVSARDADAMIARAGQIAALGNVAGIAAARRGAQIAEPGVQAAGKALQVMSGFTGVGGAAQLAQAYLDEGATKTNIAMAGLMMFGLGGADDILTVARGVDEIPNIARRSSQGARLTQETLPLLSSGKTIRHHIFNKFRGGSAGSQKYRDFFSKHGIDVDRYAVEIPETVHRKFIHTAGKNWTTRWKEWIDLNPNATTTEVYQFAGQLMDEYGLSALPIVPYR